MTLNEGPGAHVLAIDALVEVNQDDWFINEVKHYVKRTSEAPRLHGENILRAWGWLLFRGLLI